MPRRQMAALTLAVSVMTVAFATHAGAAIEVQRGAAGIELEMTVAEVLAAKGEADAEHVYPNEIFGESLELRYGKTKVLFAGSGERATAFNVRTTSRGQRTADGLGVGSTEKQVLESLPRAECSDRHGYHYCAIGRLEVGKRYTSFVFSNATNRVKWVNLAIIVD